MSNGTGNNENVDETNNLSYILGLCIGRKKKVNNSNNQLAKNKKNIYRKIQGVIRS